MMIFLSEDELRELTGYALRSKQIDWLRKNNWKFEVTGQLKPRVARSYFEVRLGGNTVAILTANSEVEKRPNFAAISRISRK